MAITVNTNVPSLNAQRNLNINAASLGKAMQRLSSGLRINSSADDAAGMGISQGLTAQVKGLTQAIRNAGDGLSLLGTAEGAVSEQTNILQRLRELAVQAANDTNNATNRDSINKETTQLKNEFDRIAKTVQFNGINLLDGSFTTKDLQVGANSGANERISVDIDSTRWTAVGSAYKLSGTASVTTTALSDGGVTINANGKTTNVGASTDDGVSTAGDTYSALAKANAINAVFSETNVSATASTTVTSSSVTAGTLDGTNSLTINGQQISQAGITADAAGALALATAINAKTAETGVQATTSSDTVVLTAADGRNIEITTAGTGHTISGFNGSATTVVNRGTLVLSSASEFTVGGAQVAALGASVTGKASQDTSENVSTIDLTTKANANKAIGIIDVAISNLNSRRGAIGAVSNRLNITIASLSSASENASASNSRIQDADFATETAAMSRSNIMQQAGVAVLSQANQSPQLALSLLR